MKMCTEEIIEKALAQTSVRGRLRWATTLYKRGGGLNKTAKLLNLDPDRLWKHIKISDGVNGMLISAIRQKR